MRDYRIDRPERSISMTGVGPKFTGPSIVIGIPLHEQIVHSLDTGLVQIDGGSAEYFDGDSSEVTPEASFGMTRIDRIEYARSKGFDAKASELFASITNAPSSVGTPQGVPPVDDGKDENEGSKGE